MPKGKTERVTPYISAFIYVHLITALVCLYYPGDLTVVALLHLLSAKVSISRNCALKSIIKYLEFLIDIPGSSADKSQMEKGEKKKKKHIPGNALLGGHALKSCPGTVACLVAGLLLGLRFETLLRSQVQAVACFSSGPWVLLMSRPPFC